MARLLVQAAAEAISSLEIDVLFAAGDIDEAQPPAAAPEAAAAVEESVLTDKAHVEHELEAAVTGPNQQSMRTPRD